MTSRGFKLQFEMSIANCVQNQLIAFPCCDKMETEKYTQSGQINANECSQVFYDWIVNT